VYELNDTILAVSSPTSAGRVIVRLSGTGTIGLLNEFFAPSPIKRSRCITGGRLRVDRQLDIDASVYLFPAPHSYTGQDVGEIHIYANNSVIETLLKNFLSSAVTSVRLAGPGEFTARAYLNGKMDLSQAEAVNEIIVSTNTWQLQASQKLLAGRLTETTRTIRSDIMDCIGLLEAGLDFSSQDIEVISPSQALQNLEKIRTELYQLITGSISFEEITDLPAVGIAGATNAGKSSLVNALLGTERSIVSEQKKTTRDVLTGTLELPHSSCVLFDCAGLISSPKDILEQLSQQAAVEAINNSAITIFCIDLSKSSFSSDLALYNFIEAKPFIHVAAKADLLDKQTLPERISILNKLFAATFLPASSKTGLGLELLRSKIDAGILKLTGFPEPPDSGQTIPAESISHRAPALTARHRNAVNEAVDNVCEAIKELKKGNDEITAMLLRAAYQNLSNITQHHIDEKILTSIFSQFCIGK